MPFVTKEHREKPNYSIPGDRCYTAYVKLMEAWTAEPRWTTVDRMAEFIWPNQWNRAMMLAFLVFFCKVVMPYEIEKEKQNGGIDGKNI